MSNILSASHLTRLNNMSGVSLILSTISFLCILRGIDSFELTNPQWRGSSKLYMPFLTKAPTLLPCRDFSVKFGTKLEASNGDDNEDVELVLVRSRRNRRKEREYYDNASEADDNYSDYNDGKYEGRFENDDDEDFDVDDDDDFDDDDEDYGLLDDVLVPNALLDSIDPDGAAERFPELARDPRFWFDMLLFVVFLDFVSYAGPRSFPIEAF